MQRQVCWVERQDDGTRREVRVTVSRDKVKWQFKVSTEEKWDYRSPPLAADCMENRYQRRNVPHADLELVRRLHRAQPPATHGE